jgi:hypothetical protein
MCSGDATGEIVVMAAKMDVAVNGTRQDILPLGVDVLRGGRQEIIGADGYDLLALDGNAGVVGLTRGHHLSAVHNDVDSCGWHVCSSSSRSDASTAADTLAFHSGG